jgi:hypothetical protein
MSKKFHLNTLIAASTLSLLAACGGSGDAPPPLDPQGIWTGAIDLPDEEKATTDTVDVVALLTSEGKLWMFTTNEQARDEPELFIGEGGATGSTYSTTGLKAYDSEALSGGSGADGFTFKGIVEDQTTMRVTLAETEGDAIPPFTLNADPNYDETPSVEALELEPTKLWQFPAADSTSMHFKINANSITSADEWVTGAFVGEYGDGTTSEVQCTFEGTITANEKNYYDITLTVDDELPNCADDNLVFTGVGVVQDTGDNRTLYIGLEANSGDRVIFAPLKIEDAD